MITNKELTEVTLSTTKKDYYQIWNELLELADKISERWSPASTNESDPGIVLLKVLTAVADKLNYNIDKNTLEAFMPSATQEDSMRKLTEMMGYNMKHYQSATGKATISYKSSNETSIKEFTEGIYFPKFINLKNEDEDVNYITLEDFILQANADSYEVPIIEGELIECETNNDNIITALHLDDSNRYILPEYSIAENGIFVTNIKDSAESSPWRREQNLNAQQPDSHVYKFGFDSSLQLPYIQFPDDIKTLIEDGIRIKYVRTNGLNGNISSKVLSKFEKPTLWSTADEQSLIRELSVDNFIVTNNSAAINGTNPESLNTAYNNYKKTIGTFDTLVTCRDYMNKIYQMTESDTDTTPLVSNIIVSDIRDDINRSTPVCTFNEYGICYKDMSLTEPLVVTLNEGNTYTTIQNKIEHFDLVFYPFKTIYGLNNKTEYKNSFKYTAENLQKIQADLALNKTIAHNIVQPIVGEDDSDIACIKNYLKLKAKITTTKKVTLIEESEILNNIYKALYTNFNARQVDFGEEIPYESLVDVIKNADYRIKDINLEEPVLNTKFCLTNNTELALSDEINSAEQWQCNKLYNKLALRNVLAGKISAFEYNSDFISEYDKSSYPNWTEEGKNKKYSPNYPVNDSIKITSIVSEFDVNTAYNNRDTTDGLVLKENEVIQFRVPNFKTTKTYPAYVNYFIKLNSRSGTNDACPATMQPLKTYMAMTDNWNSFVNNASIKGRVRDVNSIINDETTFNNILNDKVVLFTKDDKDVYNTIENFESDKLYYYLPINDDIFAAFNIWVKSQDSAELVAESTSEHKKLNGIYRTVGVQEKPFGYLIDEDLKKYLPAYKFGTVASNKEVLENFYVQVTHEKTDNLVTSKKATADGLGSDASYTGIPKDGEYQLKSGEYLLINYTDSKTDESGTERKSVVNKEYTEGDIIRANFELIDSSLYKNNHSYSKRDGFSFSGKQPEGMFTLGTNEQIEIREEVKVILNDETTYLYWILNSDDPNNEENEFIFDENYNGGINNAYTLKDGETLYYTNSKKQDLVFYGAGTLVVKNSNTPKLCKYASLGEVSAEEIMTNGLAASIPWQPYMLNSKDRQIEIRENQYISLTEGDVLISIDDTDIGNNWTEIDTAEYRFAEDENNTLLPVIDVANIKWNVRSRLDFNMSKTIAQPLNVGDSITINFTDDSSEILSPKEFDGNFLPLYVNSNYTCQAALDTIQIQADTDSNQKLKLKISSKNTPKVYMNEDLTLNNYINGEAKYTKFNFENIDSTNTADPAFSLNISIPSGNFGLIAIYYISNPGEEEAAGAYIKAKNGEDYDEKGISFFNEVTETDEEEFYLRKNKLNIIKVEQSTTQLEIYPNTTKKGAILFSNLDLVSGINEKLDYRITSSENDLQVPEGFAELTDVQQRKLKKLLQLLKDIRETGIASDFYYNIPIQSSNDIDLNPYIDEDKLSSPLAWYDPNNVNRKFVISEIDADYLSTGITLTKASRV